MARSLTALSLLTVADALLVGTPAMRRAAPKINMDTTNFYAVYHTFPKTTTPEDWWGAVAGVDFAEMAKEQHEAGVYNHLFLPADVEGPILCLWECQDLEMTSTDFKAFIDGPTSPAATLDNKVFPINPSAQGTTSAWPTMPAAPTASTGSFFWVMHKFNKGKAPEFWDNMAAMSPEDVDAFAAANKAKGYFNHYFMPTTEPETIFCIWETKAEMDAADFQSFIDADVFPGTFTNTVYPVMPGASVPSAGFPVSWLDETMKKIEEILPLSLDEIVAKIKEATKMA